MPRYQPSNTMRLCSVVALLMTLAFAHGAVRPKRDSHDDSESAQSLFNAARDDLVRSKAKRPNYKVARNTILVVGDGLGISTVTASRIYMGQQQGLKGEGHKLSFEDFPHVGLSKTYCMSHQTPDSAGTATAMLTGVKTNYGVLGVTAEVPYGTNCSKLTEETKLRSIVDMAVAEGKSIGIVTTTRITHATPAAAFAYSVNRYWESDTNKKDSPGCDHVPDHAYQLVMNNKDINVLLGGGWRSFIPNNVTKPPATAPNSNQRSDGLDLIEEWKKDKTARKLKHTYVENTGELKAVDPSKVDYLLGLFSSSHMDYDAFRDKTDNGQPSLTEMVDKALPILKKNPKGFFLLVESGRIDHAHHDSVARLALDETVQLDSAVRRITAHTSDDDTLMIVTADHSHVFTMGGYPFRGADILGPVNHYPVDEEPRDNLPYLILGYTNGPNGRHDGPRTNYTNVNTTGYDFVQPADVDIAWESHGGEDVAIYSRGPMSHLFHSTHEQHYIGHVMMYAMCLGEYSNDCDRQEREKMQDDPVCAGDRTSGSLALALTLMAGFIMYWL